VFGDWTLPNPAGELRELTQTTYLDLREALCDTEERAVNREKKRGRDPCAAIVYVHLLQSYERHHKVRNRGGMHGGLGITQDYRQHCGI